MFFDSEYIQFTHSDETVTLVNQDIALPIVVLDNEHKSVKRVAKDLQKDIKKVTERQVNIHNYMIKEPSIIIGTVENKELLAHLEIDESELKGKWETFLIETLTLNHQKSESILILGSDNRGAIYGVYDLTEKMGVSPWYWWMDVPIEKQSEIYVQKGKVIKGEPSVKYRGFFLNDEGPSLMTWVRTHFPDFTHEFYEKIFELTLRLKGNYHWPAMWDSTFYEDDDLNIVTADLYGVVIGTSHHEPMNRPHGDWKQHKKGPWDYVENEEYLKEFWTEGIERTKSYETIPNLGMRGDGDEPMGGDLTFKEKTELMEKIIKDQRKIIQKTMDSPIEKVPQMWALYKEVKEYYESGMEVPEDVILLWGDDNFGNIRRLPTVEERKRSGGAGIYYHFDYVGGPRSYKWINTVPIQKTYEQMEKAYSHEADKVWIVNVGDLKPMEYQTEFFLRLAWDIDRFNPDNLQKYAKEWAAYTFGEEFKKEIAEVIHGYVKFNGRIKPEVNNLVEQYSWENEFEAERELRKFEGIIKKAENVFQQLPDQYKDAFYQVGYYPAKASYTVLKLQLLVNLSDIYKKEGRLATNDIAQEAKRLFQKDKQLTFEYNKRVSSGKWDHMMDQIHIGYTYWQQPDELSMPEVEVLENKKLIDEEWEVKVLGSNQTDVYSKKPVTFEIFNKGNNPIDLKVSSESNALNLSFKETKLWTQERLVVDVNWDSFEKGKNIQTKVKLMDSEGKQKEVILAVHNPEELLEDGYVAVDEVISIEAEDYTDKKDTPEHQWKVIPDYGRTKSALAVYPTTFLAKFKREESPSLTYDIVLDEDVNATIYVITAPSLNLTTEEEVRLAVSVNEEEPEILSAGDLSQDGEKDSADWERSVIYNAHVFKSTEQILKAGKQKIHVHLVESHLAIQKIIVDLGGLKQTFLGPKSTPHTQFLDQYIAYQPIEKIDYIGLSSAVKIEKPEKNFAVYVKEQGFYELNARDKQLFNTKINHQIQNISEKSIIYLDEGWQTIEIQEDLTVLEIKFVKHFPIHLSNLVFTKETNEKQEFILQVQLHCVDKYSHLYRINIEAYDEQECLAQVQTKNTLKKDEQEVLTFIFDSDKISGATHLDLNLEVDGWNRKIKYPIED